MGRVLAMTRATWLTAVSYRMGLVLSLLAVGATFIPIYFVSQALQPIVADSIRNEGGDYFSFLVVGLVVVSVVFAAVGAFPGRLSSAISAGTLEAVLATPTRPAEYILGVTGYDLLWSSVKSVAMLLAGIALGVTLVWPAAFMAVGVLVLIVAAYLAIGVIAGAAILVFRTAGPIVPAVITASSLLGGVYYSTSVIPSWIHGLAHLIPLTYGLRAMRRLMLDGASLAAVAGDIGILAAFAAGLVALSAVLFSLALRHAKRAGTLAYY